MSVSLRIAEVAEQVGISTATVRYYERIGVLPPAERADNGYRVYDERTVDRLRFIGRAKQLGCTLDEIVDLVTAWEGGECGPVQDRLRSLVAAKLVDAQTEIHNLILITGDLHQARASLERHRPAGPCDGQCGCIADPGPTAGPMGAEVAPLSTATFPVMLTAKANRASDQPPVCRLAPGPVPISAMDWTTAFGSDSAPMAIPGGVRLKLKSAIDFATAARLVASEHERNPALAFRLTIDHHGIGLDVATPDCTALPQIQPTVGAPV